MVQCSNCSKYISLNPSGSPISIHIYDNGQTLVTCSGHGLADGDVIRIYDTTCTHPVEGTYTIDLAANPESEFYIPYVSTVAEECTGYFISLSDDEPDDLYDNPRINCYSYYYLPYGGSGGGGGGGITYCGCVCANCCPTGFIWFYYFIDSQSFTRCISDAWETTVHLCNTGAMDFTGPLAELSPQAFIPDSTCTALIESLLVPPFLVESEIWPVKLIDYENPENLGGISYDPETGITEVTTLEPHFLIPGSPGDDPPSAVSFYRIGPGRMDFIHEWIEETYEDEYGITVTNTVMYITTSKRHQITDPFTTLSGWNNHNYLGALSIGSIIRIDGEYTLVLSTTREACLCPDLITDCCQGGKVRYEDPLFPYTFNVIYTPTSTKFQLANLSEEEREKIENEADTIFGQASANEGLHPNISCNHLVKRYNYWWDTTNWDSERMARESDTLCLYSFIWGDLIPFSDEILDYVCCSEFRRTLSVASYDEADPACCLMPADANFYIEWDESGLVPQYQSGFASLNNTFYTVGPVVAKLQSSAILNHTCEKLPKRLPSETSTAKNFVIEHLGNTTNKTKITISGSEREASVGQYIYIDSTSTDPSISGFFQVTEDVEGFPNSYIIDTGSTFPSGTYSIGSGYGWENINPTGGPCNVYFSAEAINFRQNDARYVSNIFLEIPESRQLCGTINVTIETSGAHLFCDGEQVTISQILVEATPEDLTLPTLPNDQYAIAVISSTMFSVQIFLTECFEVPESNPSDELILANVPIIQRQHEECCTTIVVLDDKNNKTQTVNLEAKYCVSCSTFVPSRWQDPCCPSERITSNCFSYSCEIIECEGSNGTLQIIGCEPEVVGNHVVYYKKNYYEGDSHRGFSEFIACPTPPLAAFRSRITSNELSSLADSVGIIEFAQNDQKLTNKIYMSKNNYKQKKINFNIGEWNNLNQTKKTFLQIKYNINKFKKSSCIFKIQENIKETEFGYEIFVHQIYGKLPPDDAIVSVEFVLPPKTTSSLSKLNKLEILKRIKKRRY